MKKILVLLLVLVSAFALFADTNYTSSRGTNDSEQTGSVGDFTWVTTKENPIVYLNDQSVKFSSPVMITSLGQGTAAATISGTAKKLGLNYVLSTSANASDLSKYKTIIIGVGKSGKGLGGAGVTIDQEFKRANDIVAYLKSHTDVKCIVAHVEGSDKRTGDSDKLLNIILPEADYVIVYEEADYDHLFTNFSNTNKVPVALCNRSKSAQDVLKKIFN